ncbi:MAG: hypothetical protein EVA36_04140 [Flavobacteriales bacterium]|nr:MAG: hypothetical protein CBC56_004970 [Flavobacteriales bacterium TMED96]RZP11209.1 MAG: hypothetical protein EVA36_04140 [Flavobacteriales bacterium]|tara:strand:+ start:1600 stop:2091 length:492 start_codon:yes stop_codon:yes gene_type:complete
MFKFILSFKIFALTFFQNYSIRVIDNLGYNLGSYLISDKNDREVINGETINFSDFVRYIQKNQNEITINQYNDIVNKMARIELNRARRKYESTFAQYVMESPTVLKDENIKRKKELNYLKENLADYKFYIDDFLININEFISDPKDCNSDFFISYNEFFKNCK